MGLLLPLGYFGSTLTTDIVNNVCNQMQDYRLPGDPAGIRQIVYTNLDPLSATLGDAMNAGSTVIAAKEAGAFMEGKTADGIVETLNTRIQAMGNIRQGIDEVSSALLQWADQLEACQAKADTARDQAIDYARSFVQWDGERANAIDLGAVAQALLDSAGDDAETAATASADLESANTQAQDAEYARDTAGGGFSDWYSQIIHAQDDYETYAQECALAIARIMGSPAMTESAAVLKRNTGTWASAINFTEALGKALTAMFSPVATIVEKGVSGLLTTSNALADAAAKTGKAIGSAVSGLFSGAAGAVNAIGATASDALAGMGGNLTTVVSI